MKVLVVGGGGREHAIIKKLKESKEIDELVSFTYGKRQKLNSKDKD